MKRPDIKKILEKFKKVDIGNIRLKNMKLKKQTLFVVIGAAIVLIILVRTTTNIQNVLFKKKPKKAPVVTFEEEAPPVKALKIRKMDFKDTLPCIGNVKGFKEIDLKFQTSGILESFNFEEGEKIQEGDIIASLVQKEALLKLKYAEIELNKNKKLFEIGAISQMKHEQTKVEYESAKNELDKTNIYAMSNGLLGARLIDVGSYVTPNDKAGTFVNIDKVYTEFNIIEKDAPKLALGQRVEVFVDAYPNKSFAGAIDRISPIIEGRSRTQSIKVELDNKDGALKPGMFARALVATYEKKEALVIPVSGLKKKEAEYFAYVIHKEEPKKEDAEGEAKEKPRKILGFAIPSKKPKDEPKAETKEKPAEFGTVEARTVKLGYMTQDMAEISEGLKEDELIIVEIQEEFKDKTRVEIAELQEGIL